MVPVGRQADTGVWLESGRQIRPRQEMFGAGCKGFDRKEELPPGRAAAAHPVRKTTARYEIIARSGDRCQNRQETLP